MHWSAGDGAGAKRCDALKNQKSGGTFGKKTAKSAFTRKNHRGNPVQQVLLHRISPPSPLQEKNVLKKIGSRGHLLPSCTGVTTAPGDVMPRCKSCWHGQAMGQVQKDVTL